MSAQPLAPSAPTAPAQRAEPTLAAVRLTGSAVRRSLDLAQQGFLAQEIADLLETEPADVDAAISALVPGGVPAIHIALCRRLRAWRRDLAHSAWGDAEIELGIPHAHVLRLARVPRDQEAGIVELGEPGFLDTVLSGTGCRDERAARSARLYAFGATLQEIGDLYGVSRERIRQILARSTPWSSTALQAAAKSMGAARATEQAAAVGAWSAAHPAAPIAAAVAELGLSGEQIREILGRRRSRHEAASADTPRTSHGHSDQAIIADLRAFHAETGKTTCAAFTAWARTHGVPGHQTASIRFGTWNDALNAAGVVDVVGTTRSAFSDEDLWAAVVAAVRADDGGTTYRAVEDWLARHPAAPSGVLVRQRLSRRDGHSWPEIATIALAVINDPGSLLAREGTPTIDAAWIDAVAAERDWDTPVEEPSPLEHIRAAIAVLGPTLTTAQYRVWARAENRPTMQTLQRRTGKLWSVLLEEAGGNANAAKAKGRTREQVGAFLVRFLVEHPEGTTSAYARWAPTNAAPSLSTVADRFGAWSEAMDWARQQG
ncbi:homing endonuclease associated repeat-containing protein [Brachybacterium sp. DNPG3]